jgi:7-cyano-7-deazaguanine synthase
MKIITTLSGGMDSTTLLFQLLNEGHEVKTLGVNYGQRHVKELQAAQSIAEQAGIEYRIVDLTSITDLISNSALTGSEEVPHGHYADESMRRTVVANRNMIMLSVAAGWAINLGYDAIATAVHSGDHAIYPDCRPEFIEAMRSTLAVAGYEPVKVLAPFVEIPKDAIAKIGADLGVPYKLTWSCYEGRDIHCGLCGTCVERKEAFHLAGVPDPTEYSNG